MYASGLVKIISRYELIKYVLYRIYGVWIFITFFLCRFTGRTLRGLRSVVSALGGTIRFLVAIWKPKYVSDYTCRVWCLHCRVSPLIFTTRLEQTSRYQREHIKTKKQNERNYTPWYHRFRNSKLNIFAEYRHYVHYISAFITSDKRKLFFR